MDDLDVVEWFLNNADVINDANPFPSPSCPSVSSPVRVKRKRSIDDLEEAENRSLRQQLFTHRSVFGPRKKHLERLKQKNSSDMYIKEYIKEYCANSSRISEHEVQFKALQVHATSSKTLRMLLWILCQDNLFYEIGSSFWELICSVLELSSSQRSELMSLRVKANSIALSMKEIESGFEMPESNVLYKRKAWGLDNSLSVLNKSQLVKMISKVESERLHSMLHTLLKSLTSFDTSHVVELSG